MSTTTDPFIQNAKLGRGVNILGYDPIWKSRTDGRMRAKHFTSIAEAGFTHVRINLHPFSFMGDGPDHALNPSYLETLDWALEQCCNNGLHAIIDMHEFTAMAKDPTGLKSRFLRVWEQLAYRYKDTPDSVILEILNEPNTLLTVELWNEFLKEPLGIIRETNPTRTVIIGPAFWNGIDHLDRLELPGDDRNIIVTVHYYHPMGFTHQGAPWAPEFVDKVGTPWMGLPHEVQAIRDDFEGVREWSKANDRPIYLGEFGAYDKADMESRVGYTDAVAREAERLGWSWGYWQFDSDFIVYDLEADAWVEPIRDALIPKP